MSLGIFRDISASYEAIKKGIKVFRSIKGSPIKYLKLNMRHFYINPTQFSATETIFESRLKYPEMFPMPFYASGLLIQNKYHKYKDLGTYSLL